MVTRIINQLNYIIYSKFNCNFGFYLSGAVSISTWAMLWSTLIFGSLNLLKILRVSDSDEYIGKKCLWGAGVRALWKIERDM